MKKIYLKRFIQDPAHCAVAATASIAHHYNKKIDYEYAKELIKRKIIDDINGLYDGQTVRLLNYLGFQKVILVVSDIDNYDWTWNDLSKKQLIQELKKAEKIRGEEYGEDLRETIDCLKDKNYKNELTVDYRVDKYMKRYLDRDIPLLVFFNWNKFFRFVKTDEEGQPDPISGNAEYHMVACCGYSSKSVYIVDSHDKCYKYRLKKYSSGRYCMSWPDVMGVVSGILIPCEYKEDLCYELV